MNTGIVLTLVTGINSKYFEFLKQLLSNVIEISSSKNINIRIIVYDLGMNQNEIDEIRKFSYVTLESFNFDKYPEHVSLKKYNGLNCNYAWKPIIIHEVCEKYGGLVHWMDTRNLYTDFNNMINILKKDYIYTPVSPGNVANWTYPNTLKYMNGYKYMNCQCRAGGIFGINYDIEWCKMFVEEWKNLALVKECICPENSNRSNHRQDQAVLTILFYKYQEKYNFKYINYYVDLTVHNSLIT
jgi:hypothetical protein